jgi:ABC-type Zn2+ transport system substrate-binding protein/surface adhesin
MFSSNRNVLLKSFKKNLNSKINKGGNFSKLILRSFGTHQHDTHDHKGHHDHGHGDDSHGHGHGHHEITGEVDLSKVFVPMNSKTAKLVSLIGLPSNDKYKELLIEGDNKAANAITPIPIPFITKNRVFHQDLANVTKEENPYFHPEPYGYLVSDDVFYF